MSNAALTVCSFDSAFLFDSLTDALYYLDVLHYDNHHSIVSV